MSNKLLLRIIFFNMITGLSITGYSGYQLVSKNNRINEVHVSCPDYKPYEKLNHELLKTLDELNDARKDRFDKNRSNRIIELSERVEEKREEKRKIYFGNEERLNEAGIALKKYEKEREESYLGLFLGSCLTAMGAGGLVSRLRKSK